ncbi:MAG: hypothetical protein L0H93_02745 [Nocardioides sp.]|nr:hypothetical protein [Nocardioides sp.]
MTSTHAQRLFDGESWVDDVTIVEDGGMIVSLQQGHAAGADSVPTVLPGLVDSGAWIEGYVEGPLSDGPFFPESSFCTLCRAHGVTSVVDLGAGVGVARWLLHSPMLNVLSAIARVCDIPTRRSDLVVDPTELGEVLECLQTLGARLVSLGLFDPVDSSERASVLARHGPVVVGQHVGHRPRPSFLVLGDDQTVQAGLAAGSMVEPPRDAFVAPQLLATSLWTVDGMLRGGDGTQARPFLPYMKHFEGASNFMSRRIARDILTKLYGHQRPEDLDGGIETSLGRVSSDRILAASGAGTPGIVPGQAIWDELLLIEKLKGTEGALQSATANAADAYPGLGAGRVKAGYRCDLALVDVVPQPCRVADLRERLLGVVVGGEREDITVERLRIKELCATADRRAI